MSGLVMRERGEMCDDACMDEQKAHWIEKACNRPDRFMQE